MDHDLAWSLQIIVQGSVYEIFISKALSMSNLLNPIVNSALSALTSRAPTAVLASIEQASAKTGVDFSYLVQQAAAESDFRADVKAKTSSASGLFQFIESTWMNMVERYGDKHGLETEGKTRAEVLALRNDPEAASVMAAEFASENERFLRQHYDGEIGATELYFAHFLGAGNAAAFLNARDENGMKDAAQIFPSAANVNQSVFYHADGRSKSLDEVYAYFDQKFQIDEDPYRDVAVDMTTESYQMSFSGYDAQMPKKMTMTKEEALAIVQRMQAGYNGGMSSYQSMLSNPVELMLMTQMMDLPLSSKDGDFQLYSSYKNI